MRRVGSGCQPAVVDFRSAGRYGRVVVFRCLLQHLEPGQSPPPVHYYLSKPTQAPKFQLEGFTDHLPRLPRATNVYTMVTRFDIEDGREDLWRPILASLQDATSLVDHVLVIAVQAAFVEPFHRAAFADPADPRPVAGAVLGFRGFLYYVPANIAADKASGEIVTIDPDKGWNEFHKLLGLEEKWRTVASAVFEAPAKPQRLQFSEGYAKDLGAAMHNLITSLTELDRLGVPVGLANILSAGKFAKRVSCLLNIEDFYLVDSSIGKLADQLRPESEALFPGLEPRPAPEPKAEPNANHDIYPV